MILYIISVGASLTKNRLLKENFFTRLRFESYLDTEKVMIFAPVLDGFKVVCVK